MNPPNIRTKKTIIIISETISLLTSDISIKKLIDIIIDNITQIGVITFFIYSKTSTKPIIFKNINLTTKLRNTRLTET